MKLLTCIFAISLSLPAFAFQAQTLDTLEADARHQELARAEFRLEPGESQIQFFWNDLQQINGLKTYYERSLTCSGFGINAVETLNTQGEWVSMKELEFEGSSYFTAANKFISLRMTVEVSQFSRCMVTLADRNEALPNVQTVLATTIETCEGAGEEVVCTNRLNRVAGAELATLNLLRDEVRAFGLRPGQIYKIVGYEMENEEGEIHFHISSAQWIMAEET